MATLNVDTIQNSAGTGAPAFPYGWKFSAVTGTITGTGISQSATDVITVYINSVAIGVWASTGLAVTGTLSCSGVFSPAAAIAFTGNGSVPTCGLYRSATNTIKIATAGTDWFVLDSAGRIGLGTMMTPTSGNPFYAQVNSDSIQSWTFENTSVGGTARSTLKVTSGTVEGVFFGIASSGVCGMGTNSAHDFTLYSTGSARCTLQTGTGYFGINRTSPATFLDVRGSNTDAEEAVYIRKVSSTTTTSQFFVQFLVGTTTACGRITASGAGAAAFGSTSDERVKKNIRPIGRQLENICALNSVDFEYIDEVGGGSNTGFTAQNMRDVYPDVVCEDEKGILLITGWSKTEARLVQAIKDLQADLMELRSLVVG